MTYVILRNFTSSTCGLFPVYYENHSITDDLLMLTHTPLEIEWLIKLGYIKETTNEASRLEDCNRRDDPSQS